MANKYVIGFLVLVLLSASIYVLMPDSVKVLVENTRTKYYVWENESWVLGGIEYVNLFDGTTKMRASSRILDQTVTEESITIIRTSTWKDNITTIQTYTFDGSLDDVEMVPVANKFECINCQGKIVHYEFRDISYDGITRGAISPETFGHNIKVEWQDGYDWAKVYQLKTVADKLIIRYRPNSDYEVYNVRVFDPIASLTAVVPNCKTYIEYYNVTEPIYETKQIYDEKNDTYYDLISIKDYKIVTLNRTYEVCEPYLKVTDKTVDYKKQGFNCKQDGKEIICDSCTDGNCDGICDPRGGETCCKVDAKGNIICKNSIEEWTETEVIQKLELRDDLVAVK